MVSTTSRRPGGHRRRERPPAPPAGTLALPVASFNCSKEEWGRVESERPPLNSAMLCVGKRHSARSACLIIATVVKISTRLCLILYYSQRQQIFLGSHCTMCLFFMHVFAVRFRLPVGPSTNTGLTLFWQSGLGKRLRMSI